MGEGRHQSKISRMRDQTRQNESSFVTEGMLLLNPFCLIRAGQVAGLKATIVILMMMLMKSKLLRVKMSLLGSLIGFTLLVGFLLTTGVLTLVAGGAVVYAAKK
jgi:hypothetical protein